MITRSCQFWSTVMKVCPQLMGTLFRVEKRQFYRWAANPDCCGETSRGPDLLLRSLYKRLQELGREDVVEGSLRVICGPLGYDVVKREVECDHCMTGEVLDVQAALGRVAEGVSKVLLDGKVEWEEKREILALIDCMARQVAELKEAVDKA